MTERIVTLPASSAKARCTLGYWRASRALLLDGNSAALDRLTAILECPDEAVAHLAQAARGTLATFDKRRAAGV